MQKMTPLIGALSGVTTCKCGHTYVIGHRENETAHKVIHEEFSFGPEIPEIQALPKIASKGDLSLSVVDKSVGEPIRKAFARVAMVAHRCMPDYKSGYYGADTEEDSRLYALANGTRIIGMAISSMDESFWRMSWISESEYRMNSHKVVSRRGPKIARVWVAESYRRQNLAKWLIEETVKDLVCDLQNLGWEMPLTRLGKSLVKALFPNDFLGCGNVCSR
jgi:hypothetical protein